MFKVDLKKVALPKLEALMASLTSPDAPHWMEAGVLVDATNEVQIPNKKKPGFRKQEKSVAKYARWNEYGTTRIPKRPFMRNAFDAHSREWANTATGALRAHICNAGTEGGRVLELALMAAGNLAQADIVKSIQDAGSWAAPNAHAYARWKEWYRDDDQGDPLTLTATLSKSIQYQLTTEGGAVVGEPSPMSGASSKGGSK